MGKIMKMDNLGQPQDNLKKRGCPAICSISTGFFDLSGQPSNLFTEKTIGMKMGKDGEQGNKKTGKGWEVVHVVAKTLIALGQTAGQPQKARLPTGWEVVLCN